jgi:hypothetical protein
MNWAAVVITEAYAIGRIIGTGSVRPIVAVGSLWSARTWVAVYSLIGLPKMSHLTQWTGSHCFNHHAYS